VRCNNRLVSAGMFGSYQCHREAKVENLCKVCSSAIERGKKRRAETDRKWRERQALQDKNRAILDNKIRIAEELPALIDQFIKDTDNPREEYWVDGVDYCVQRLKVLVGDA